MRVLVGGLQSGACCGTRYEIQADLADTADLEIVGYVGASNPASPTIAA